MSDLKTRDLAKAEFAKLKYEEIVVPERNVVLGESIIELTKEEVILIMEAFRQGKTPAEIRRNVKRGEVQCFTYDQIQGVFEAWQETILEKAPVSSDVLIGSEEKIR